MHSDQVDVDVVTVASLVADALPGSRGAEIRPVPSHGTVNALFRVGDDLVARFPLQPDASAEFRAELSERIALAHRLAERLPLAIPEPVAVGEPGPGYPGLWTVHRWLPGATADTVPFRDPVAAAHRLAEFVSALRAVGNDGRGWPGVGRGGPLADHDAAVTDALARSGHLIDTAPIERLWRRCVAAPAYSGTPARIHADLMPGNLLVRDGELVGVLDFEIAGIGDPAVDMLAAWTVWSGEARKAYRHGLAADDEEWLRGRGWAVLQAIMALPYYVETNPMMARIARRTLEALRD
ncbi:aminoglycoside phosphotransferase (APT) family kinase protein [Stackebrandtia albiflava]|uniref:Aminoglycoside phosphotransferase (APT) family kinase protein n=2 Tax=Stackebrandtia albiflava TaxID=406432 RepID=A0A562V1N3_9ACTN|nr:aminoglycoside phosphotransferase (APT) family kinase protein [Stackebrandtia albiflava]